MEIIEVKNYLKKEYPNFNGFIEHTLVAEMALKFAKEYNKKKLSIHDVVGQSELLPCEHDYQPDTTCGVDITCCTKCGDII